MKYYVRTTGNRVLHESYQQLDYELITDYEHKPIDSFIQSLYKISDDDAVLFEDDLVICRDFVQMLECAVKSYPGQVINFFQNPIKYLPTRVAPIRWNQCTFYPKGIAAKLARVMESIPRHTDHTKNQYSFIESDACDKLGVGIVQYRPSLVQHLDYDTELFNMTHHARRTPFFIDYISELGLTYDNLTGHEINMLQRRMKDHFRLELDLWYETTKQS